MALLLGNPQLGLLERDTELERLEEGEWWDMPAQGVGGGALSFTTPLCAY